MKHNSTFADFDRKEALSFGEYLADTKQVLYAHSVWDAVSGRMMNRLILQDIESGAKKDITANGMGESDPRISPDYKRVCFVSSKSECGRQLFVYDLETDEVKQLTTMRFGLMEPIWSPDGKWILFTSFSSRDMDEAWLQIPVDPAEQAAYERERAKQPIVITDFGYKFDGLGFAQPEAMQLWIVPSDGSGKARRITSASANFMHAGWAPDSKHVLCESNLYCNKEIGIAMDVLLIDCESCEITRVTKDRMVVSYPNPVRPVFTPDGKYIIVGILDYDESHFSSTYPSVTLYRITPDGAEMTPIFQKTEECFDSVQFLYNAGCGRGLEKVQVSSDGQYVLFHAGHQGAGCIWRTPIYGENHCPQRLTEGKFAYNGMGTPANGKVLVTRTATDCPEAYYLMDEATGEVELLVQSNLDWLENKNLSCAEDFFFDTLDGESRVHGFCLPPQNREPGKKYPAIVYVHGGPHPFYTFGFDLEMQCFAGAGFGVIFCNPRGSSGYGDKHRNIERAYDGSAYTDILQCVQEACARFDWIDESRLGLTGGSYGGYMTNYTASRCSKFKAYISQRSVASDLIGYASSDMQGTSKDYPSFGEFMVHAVEESVICGMERVNAPFLILHGEDDYRCPVEGAHQMFVALKDSHPEDFPIKMVIYPRLSHDQPSHPKQRQHYYKTMVDWFGKYLV